MVVKSPLALWGTPNAGSAMRQAFVFDLAVAGPRVVRNAGHSQNAKRVSVGRRFLGIY